MITPFEIKIAVIGYDMDGKKTLLQALFQDKLSQVALDDKSVTNFRILMANSSEDGTTTTTINKTELRVDDGRFGLFQDKEYYIRLHHHDDNPFDLLCCREDTSFVFVDVPITDSNTTTDTATSNDKEYLLETSLWESFDCAMVFLSNNRQALLSPEDERLLRFVNSLMGIHRIPLLVIVGTDPTISSESKMLEQAQSFFRSESLDQQESDNDHHSGGNNNGIENINSDDTMSTNRMDTPELFLDPEEDSAEMMMAAEIIPPPSSSSSEKNLEGLGRLGTNNNLTDDVNDSESIGILVKNAFLYRYAASLSLDRLQLETDILERIGREEVGRLRWKRMSAEEQLETVYTVVNEPLQYSKRLESTNFHLLSSWLQDTISGTAIQTKMLQRQHDWAMKHLTAESNIAQKLRILHFHKQEKAEDSESLRATFWAFYRVCEQVAFAELESKMNAQALDKPITQLLEYRVLLEETKWEDPSVVETALCALVRRQIHLVLGKHRSSSSYKRWYRTRNQQSWKKEGTLTWDLLSPHDWVSLYGSILLVANNRYFCERLGQEKIVVESILRQTLKVMFHPKRVSREDPPPPIKKSLKLSFAKRKLDEPEEEEFKASDGCPALHHALDGHHHLDTGTFIPKYPETYDCLVRIRPPGSLSDPSHWGHATWRYIRYIESVEKSFFLKD